MIKQAVNDLVNEFDVEENKKKDLIKSIDYLIYCVQKTLMEKFKKIPSSRTWKTQTIISTLGEDLKWEKNGNRK